MKRKSIIYDFVLFSLIICAGVALLVFQGSPGAIDDTPSLPGLAGSEITMPANIAETNRKIVEQVEINGQNVQNVLKTLARPSDYITEGQATYYSGGQVLGFYYIKSWVRPDMSKIELYSQTGTQRKLLKNTVLTGSSVYVWETAADTLYIGNAGDFSADDLGHMPTYEQVLDFSRQEITGGALDSELGTLMAETLNPNTGFAEKWYIDIDSGLLILYQCYQNGELVSEARLNQWSAQSVEDSVFQLPNGLQPE